MVEREEAAIEFLVSHEQLAEAVEPAMADLDDPAARLPRGVAPLGISFFAATDNMSNVAVLLDDLQGATASIAGVGA